jgi:two-component system response regulator MtrA
MTSNTSISSQGVGPDTLLLCVDDDAAILAVTAALLERKGFSVIVALDWRQAIEAFRSNPVDLVILDYEMPELKGHEVAIMIRSVNADIPLILHSGAANIPEVAIKATDAVIQKGVDTSILVAAIEQLITKNRVNPKPTPPSWTAKLN